MARSALNAACRAVKLSALTIRQLGIDAAPRFGSEGIPAGRPAVWLYPLVTFHTDERIEVN